MTKAVAIGLLVETMPFTIRALAQGVIDFDSVVRFGTTGQRARLEILPYPALALVFGRPLPLMVLGIPPVVCVNDIPLIVVGHSVSFGTLIAQGVG